MKLERYIFCQYCDDVRHELDGKVSLIGVYSGGLQVSGTFPAVIGKLFVVCNIATPKERPFKKIVLTIRHDTMELMKAELPEEMLTFQEVESPERRGHLLTLAMPLPPITVSKAGQITVEIETEEGGFIANKLEIFVAQAGAAGVAQGVAAPA